MSLCLRFRIWKLKIIIPIKSCSNPLPHRVTMGTQWAIVRGSFFLSNCPVPGTDLSFPPVSPSSDHCCLFLLPFSSQWNQGLERDSSRTRLWNLMFLLVDSYNHRRACWSWKSSLSYWFLWAPDHSSRWIVPYSNSWCRQATHSWANAAVQERTGSCVGVRGGFLWRPPSGKC